MTDGTATEEPGSVGTASSAAEGSTSASGAQRPVLTVVRGEPTPEQLAALIAVVSARSAGGVEDEPAPPSRWASRAALMRQPLHPGPGAWRASARLR